VSVRFKHCSFNWNSTNYNERSFQLVNVDNAYDGTFDNSITDNPTGSQNLVGSFTVKAGTWLTLAGSGSMSLT